MNARTKVDQESKLIVVVRVNTQCSLSCQFCGYSRELRLPRHSIDLHVLSLLGERLRQHQTQSQQDVLVSWLGGEPFQWPALQPATHAFSQQYGLAISVTTNGLALANPALRMFALKHFCQITISVDGLPGDHDWLRQRSGMFTQLKSIVKKLREERNPECTLLRVNTVLTRENIHRFPEFCETMNRWGFDELTFNQLGGNDRPAFYQSHHLLSEQVESFVERLPSLRATHLASGMRIQGSPAYLERITASTQGRCLPIECCAPGERFLFVDEHGRISPCSFTTSSLSLSLLENATPISELPQWFRQTKRASPPTPCADCHATHVFSKF